MSPHAGSYQDKSKCKRCLRLLKWIPVGFILAIVFWSYYSYVILLCFYSLDNDFQLVSYLILYHVIFIMFMWAYIQTIVTPIPLPPEKFKLPPGELDRLTHADNEEMQNAILEEVCKNLAARNRTVNGGIRYCEKCKQVKPDRAHHCSVCGKCVLKMDHHCPWVNNCVCFSNYKYFILFLGYSLIYCLFISATSFQFFIMYWRGTLEGLARFHITFLFFVAVMFGISLASLFFYHIYLVSVNRTTLEAFRPPVFINGPDKNSYNLGRKANFKEIFGNKPSLWFIPVFTTIGNGVEFPMRTKNRTSYHSISRASTKTDA